MTSVASTAYALVSLEAGLHNEGLGFVSDTLDADELSGAKLEQPVGDVIE